MKILVTGASGFIGSALLRAAAHRDYHVAGLARSWHSNDFPLGDGVTRIRGTLADPPWKEIEAFAPDVCVHTAWIATPGVYLESPENKEWVLWSLKFLQRLAASGTQHIVSLGTCIEYQTTGSILSEESTPIAPLSLYARCKNELRLALDSARLPVCWARVFYPYGPGEHPARLPSSIIARLIEGREIALKTPSSTKDYIYIDDLVEALLATVQTRFLGPINLGTGTGVSVRTIARTIAAVLGRPELIKEASPEAPDPLNYVVADSTKLFGLGWHPRYSIDDGLKKLIASKQGTRNI